MQFTHIPSRQEKNTAALFPTKMEKVFTLKDIECRRTWGKIRGLVDRQVPFLPPTMSPAAAENGELESLKWAMNYFAEHGHKQLVIQEKMMGSRCVVVIRDDEEPFAISKNGWVINHVDISAELFRLRNEYGGNGEVILDCELMPWSAMGAGLIEKNFEGYGDLVNHTNNILGELNFEESISQIKDLFRQEFDSLSKSEFVKAHGHHNYSTISKYRELSANYVPVENTRENMRKYFDSLSNYTKEYPVQIRPFMILRDGNSKLFQHIDSVNQTVVNVDEVDKAYSFVESLGIDKTEGVVVKPFNHPLAGREVPYIKVRNNEYLRIVYGPNFTEPKNLARLMSKKNIYHKMRASRDQWQACHNMLCGDSIENILCKMLHKEEREMDPRL